MHVHIVRNNTPTAIISATESDPTRQYILRIQDDWLVTLHGVHITECFGDGTGIRNMTLKDGVLAVKQSIQIDNTGIATCPQRRNFGVVYLYHRPEKMYLHHHNGHEVLRQAELVTEDRKTHIYSKYVAYTDDDLTVYSSDTLSVVTHQVSRQHAVQRTIDVIKRAIVIYPDFYIQDSLFSLLREPYTDIFPIHGCLVKFDRDRHASDVAETNTLTYSYYLPVIDYHGASQAVRERLLVSHGRKVTLSVILPRAPMAYLGMTIVQGRQLLGYRIQSSIVNTKRYHLIEIAFDNMTPRVTNTLTFYVN